METKYAILDGTLCIDMAVCDDPDFAARMGWELLPDGFGPGDTLVDGQWVKNKAMAAVVQVDYETLLRQYIHERYSVDDELALHALALETLDKGGLLAQEYRDYRAYVEECKARALAESGGVQ